MPDYTVSITARQNFILVNALAQYNADHQGDEDFTPLNAQQFVNKLVDIELLNREFDVQQQYRQLIQVLNVVPVDTRTAILDTLPQRIKNYLQTL